MIIYGKGKNNGRVIEGTYNQLTVIREVEGVVVGKSKSIKRTVECICVCGNVTNVWIANLVNGHTKSCGCANGESHGEWGSRLYKSWASMKYRAIQRTINGDICSVHPSWVDYSGFKSWSLSNGYAPNKVICRNGDVGDYAPDNCRWDTQVNNMIEAKAKNWAFVSPSGKVVKIYNLSKFCVENYLNRGHMSAVHYGTRKQHKGWTKYEQ